MLPLDASEARRDAARQLLANRERVVPFAMRAMGDLGERWTDNGRLPD